MKILKRFWWILAIGTAVWWYKSKQSAAAYNGVPKYLDPNSKGVLLPGINGADFSKSLWE